jgi:hypothetical protein
MTPESPLRGFRLMELPVLIRLDRHLLAKMV